MFRKLLDEGQAGTTWGCCSGAWRSTRWSGDGAGEAGEHHAHTQFESEVYVLTKEEGGRHTPFFKGYRPQFYLRTTDVTGTVELPAGVEMVMPGDNTKMTIELITRSRWRSSCGLRSAKAAAPSAPAWPPRS